MRILLVEDEHELAKVTKRLLEQQKYVVDVAESLTIAKAAVLDNEYDIVLLDRRLPDGEGTELIHYANFRRRDTRFLILSALGDLDNRIEGLDLGADDYIVKPFEPDELFARIRAGLRRPIPESTKVLELGKLRLNCKSRNFRVSGETVVLPRREMILLETLLTGAGRVITRETLENAMYGYDDDILSNTLESHVSRLRKNLTNLDAGVIVHTIRGVGYMLKDEE